MKIYKVGQAHTESSLILMLIGITVIGALMLQGQSVHVATDSSDRSIDINLHQIEDTPTRGRNPVSLIMTLPGVQSIGLSGGRRPSLYHACIRAAFHGPEYSVSTRKEHTGK